MNSRCHSEWVGDTMQCRAARGGRVGWTIALLACLLGGCGRHEKIETVYGKRRGDGMLSVNGTSVLAGLWEEAGCEVFTRTRLSPDLETCQVLVWIPDDFQLPSEPSRQFLETWLTAEPDRTLVYVGRDFDAATEYWRAMAAGAPAAARRELLRRQGRARARHATRRRSMPEDAVCEWFVVRRDAPYRRVTDLQGPWSRVVQPDRANIWVQGQLRAPTAEQLAGLWEEQPPPASVQPVHRVLLKDASATLALSVRRPEWRGSQLVVVSNGSFLLNAPLVNQEHRKLAGQLIRTCGAPGQRVVFLESGPNGLSINPVTGGQVPSETRRRRAVLILHWLLLGLLFCFAVFPIFGRARAPQTEIVADFGQHVEALGALLEKTGDVRYARELVGHYQQVAYRESGARHAGPGPSHSSEPKPLSPAPQRPARRPPNSQGNE